MPRSRWGTAPCGSRCAPARVPRRAHAVVGWNKGAVAEPTPPTGPRAFCAPTGRSRSRSRCSSCRLLAGGGAGAIPGRRPVWCSTSPPTDSRPRRSGPWSTNSADCATITATMVDSRCAGISSSRSGTSTSCSGWWAGGVRPHRMSERRWSALAAHERKVLEGISTRAGRRRSCRIWSRSFYSNLPGIRNGIFERLQAQVSTSRSAAPMHQRHEPGVDQPSGSDPSVAATAASRHPEPGAVRDPVGGCPEVAVDPAPDPDSFFSPRAAVEDALEHLPLRARRARSIRRSAFIRWRTLLPPATSPNSCALPLLELEIPAHREVDHRGVMSAGPRSLSTRSLPPRA